MLGDMGNGSSCRRLASFIAAALLVGTAGADCARAQDAEPPRDLPARQVKDYMGRIIAPTMHYSHASWLTRPERVREEAPDRLLALLGVKPGQTVCDFGCGNGYHTLKLARQVGPAGRVLAVDIQPEMLDLLRRRSEPRGLTQIEPILATVDDSRLPAAEIDLLLMVDVYHELDQPGGVLAQVRRSLKPRGRLALVEFRGEDPQVPIRPLHKMTKVQVQKELTANGFKLVQQQDELPWQHLLIYARDDSPLPAVDLRRWSITTTRGRGQNQGEGPRDTPPGP